MWWVEGRISIAMNVLCLLVLGAIPIASMVLHRERLRDIGLRLDNLGRSAREVGIMTLAASAVIVACGIAGGGAMRVRADLIPLLPVYLIWGLLQQLALQAFVQRRLSGSMPGSRKVALLSATLFASLHFPNPVLAPATLVAGYAWCRLYARTPNLITLACSHATLAILTLLSFPPAWIHQLRVGPRYWLRG
jgi:membrane protease YdiL (CAAX protease family)